MYLDLDVDLNSALTKSNVKLITLLSLNFARPRSRSRPRSLPFTLPRSSLGFCIVLLFFCGFFFFVLLLFNLLGFWVQLSSSACVLSYKVQLGTGAVHFALEGALEPLLYLRDNEHGGGERDQKEYVVGGERLRLENHLERRKVDDQHLANDREGNGQQEHPIGGQSDCEDTLRLRATGERIEHIKEHKARECHGRIPLRLAQRAVSHLALEHPQRAQHNDACTEQYIDHHGLGDHGLLDVARLLLEHIMIHGLHAQRLCRRSVHNDIDPEYLHRIQWIGNVHQCGQCDQGQSRNRGAQLKSYKVPNIVEDAFALLNGSAASKQRSSISKQKWII